MKPTHHVSKEHGLDETAGQAAKCRRCGLCSSVCPVFEVLNVEWASPRGKLQLLQSAAGRDIEAGKSFEKVLTACVGCGRCTTRCPNQVDPKQIFLELKQVLPGKRRGKLARASAGFMSKAEAGRLSSMVKTAKLLKPVWASSLPADRGLALRMGKPGALFPDLSESSLLELWQKEELEAESLSRAGSRKPALVFPGCFHTYITPRAAVAAARILQKAGYSVSLAKEAGCCGLPALSAGLKKKALDAAVRNLEVLDADKYSIVLAPCSSCAAMLKVHYPVLAERLGTRAREKADVLASKVLTLSQILAGFSGGMGRFEGSPVKETRATVAYHAPCHLVNALADPDSGRAVMHRLATAMFYETPPRCCGQGGLFWLENSRTSEEIGRKAFELLIGTGASYMVTECSGCYLQLFDLLARNKPEVRLLWLAEAIERWGLRPSKAENTALHENHVQERYTNHP